MKGKLDHMTGQYSIPATLLDQE